MTSSAAPGDPATDSPESVLLDLCDGVATITLNRPAAHNSLDIATKESLLRTIERVGDDPDVRCVVLTGVGKAFCTGQDLKEHVDLLQGGGSEQLFTTVERHYNPIVTALAGMAKPVIASVNGVAAGAGASLAFACDLRVVSEAAGFNLAFANVALCCDTGASYHLPLLVGRAKAMELLYFPRTIAAPEALELGLATSMVAADDLDTEVRAVATRLASGPTAAYGAMRQAVAYAAGHTLAQACEFEASMMQRTGATDDHQTAVAAFVAKEKPVFRGR